eukprot:3163103-Pyramimonas_sp.AAC.1
MAQYEVGRRVDPSTVCSCYRAGPTLAAGKKASSSPTLARSCPCKVARKRSRLRCGVPRGRPA